MTGQVRFLFITIAFFATCVDGNKKSGNILVLPTTTFSYIYNSGYLAKELKKFGYNTTIVLPDGPIKTQITKEFDIDVIVSDGLTKSYDQNDELIRTGISDAFKGSLLHLFPMLSKKRQICQNIGTDKKLIKELQKRHFDIAIVNMGVLNLCACTIPYQLSIPFIRQETAYETVALRSFIHPAVYPVNILALGSEKMSYIQRIGNTLLYLLHLRRQEPIDPSSVIESFAPEVPFITNAELESKTELYLLSYDELIDYHFPVYPNMIPVGGISTRPATNLTDQLELFMSSAEYGAVIVSLGSVITWLPDDVKDNMMNAFRELPQLRFIFKFGTEAKIDGNVMLMPWLPQNDLLGHRKSKLFITHCGMNAYFEALYHAVPMIGLPVFGDQYYNAGKVKNKGYGVVLKVYDFAKNDLISAIEHVLGTPSYKDNVHNASVIFKNRPQTPAQRAVWWVDHLIKFGGKHLRPPVAGLPFYQYLMIDVIAGIIIMFTVLWLACYCSFKHICKIFIKRKLKRD